MLSRRQLNDDHRDTFSSEWTRAVALVAALFIRIVVFVVFEEKFIYVLRLTALSPP